MITNTSKITERFRTVESQILYFPREVNVFDYELIGYVQGQRVNSREPLSYNLFDQIQYVSTTRNDKENSEFIHCIGYRSLENKYTILILKKRC